jgi:biopolymer transport protein ExbD
MKMKKRPGVDKVEQQMTPMIDIVFQLLTFFVMSFKIATAEGDFNVKMPVGAPSAGSETPLPPIRVRLLAGGNGKLAGIQLGDRPIASFADLHQEIIGIVGPNSGPGAGASEYEIELDCDYGLHYSNVVYAITAASGYMDPQRGVVRLIEKIKFAPPRKGG